MLIAAVELAAAKLAVLELDVSMCTTELEVLRDTDVCTAKLLVTLACVVSGSEVAVDRALVLGATWTTEEFVSLPVLIPVLVPACIPPVAIEFVLLLPEC